MLLSELGRASQGSVARRDRDEVSRRGTSEASKGSKRERMDKTRCGLTSNMHNNNNRHFLSAIYFPCLCKVSARVRNWTPAWLFPSLQTSIWKVWDVTGDRQTQGHSCMVHGSETSLVVQWLRICLPMQGMWVWFLVGEMRSHMSLHQNTKR